MFKRGRDAGNPSVSLLSVGSLSNNHNAVSSKVYGSVKDHLSFVYSYYHISLPK